MQRRRGIRTVADNAMAIVGGRNVGDIYFGVNTTAKLSRSRPACDWPVVRDTPETKRRPEGRRFVA
jgi:phosphatidylserine/phosphatidylglycerophosphate/cardiolipin synthase-like enzyme